ncbi:MULTISPECIES: pyridoxal phosphate-dependent aminotransferase [Ensifer]|jgi:aspartate/methionine/tyrosine aminotransferase|uniref:Aminotransferase class I/II-fold pyridoxal phosphate-dependent enzyme n=1 Tax=Ensifer canadensis TaxID=555315 RepID=A0AAW4FQ25_9HYPH|nr:MULTISPECIES: pyridoxal phosphate-dependent aminotransferase [Ensifer]AHK44654.1 putative aspartate aminotransferase [Ensifer adhaerens OV14]KQU86185.1 aminotransferase [Ensifer sp. Root31]KQW58732.1 aminotransferase [Ensifer sp. Root1252]KQW74435.1 aminotransferase [Ensifer sp. Root127]KQY62156.1 aminotransferase [Ensifer sp. Root142]
MTTLPDFRLETHFSRWEFKARHHMTASDSETIGMGELLALADDADREAWDKLTLGYTETYGAPALRAAIASTYQGLSAEDILCFAGAEEGLYCAMLALLGPQDHAIVTVPNYQSMETLPVTIAASVTGVPLRPENNWRLDIADVRAALKPNTRLIAVNFPNNPTGSIADQQTFKALAELCAERGIHLFSDEVYRGLERDPALRLSQAAELFERGISLNVMSKAYGLPGLRIGWIACRDHALIERMEKMKHYLSICNSRPSEVLATIALKAREQLLTRNRALCASNLEKLGAFFAEFPALYEWREPDGGCVGFARYLGADGVETHCRRLVEEAGVLLLPSSLFVSDLLPVAEDRFRVGFGRKNIEIGLEAWRQHLRADSAIKRSA